MKFVKTVGIVVGVVALAATGVGLAMGGAALGAASGALGATAAFGATLMSIGTIASLAAGVIGLASAVFAPKPSFSQGGNPLSFQTNPQSGLPYPIGRTRMSGVRIHADTVDAPAYKSESKDDLLGFAVLLGAGGPMEEIEQFRADKEVVTFDGFGYATGTYSSWMAQAVSLGVAGAAALYLNFGSVTFPGWSADHKLSGIAHALWELRFDQKGNMYGAGVPEPEWIGKWVKVYDPRKDSTYPGGSGSHRALDETTYEWSENPPLHALTWSLGRWQNGKRTLGIGAPIENIRVADFVEAANVADANGWTCGGVEWSTDSKWSVLKRMLQAGGAEPTMTGAMIGCRVNMPRVSIATIPADKLLDGFTMATTRSRRDRFNTVIPRFRSEDHDWEVISGSPVSVPLYVEQDGGQRTKEIDFPLAQAEAGGAGLDQLGQLAAYEIVNSREAGPWSLTVGPEYIGVKTGDCITIDVPEEGVAMQPVIVRRRSVDPATLKISLEVETETEEKHDFALGKTTIPPPTYEPTPPDLTPPTPNAGLWSLAAGFSNDGLVAITIAGACEFPGADSVIMEWRKVGDANWSTLGKAEASAPVRNVISPVMAEAQYEARIAYQSGDRIGPWRNLGPVTTSEDYFTNANDNNSLTPDTPTGMTSATVAKTYDSGNVSIRNTYNFTPNADPNHRNSIDAFEHGVFISDTSAVHTMGTSDDEKWGLAINDLAGSSHSPLFVEDGISNKWYTFGVRAVRKVQKSVDPTGWIKSAIRQSAPFRPKSAQDWQGTIDGRAGSDLADAFDNYNADNDRNGLIPPAVTGVAVNSVQYADSTSQIDVSFNFSPSSSPGAAANIDGYLVGLRFSLSPAGYTYNPADDPFIKWDTIPRPDLKRIRFNGQPVDWYYTAIVIPYRIVSSDIDPDGKVFGAPAQSSSSTPHHPANSPNFSGRIDGETAALVKQGSQRANVAITSGGNIATGKVLTGSILDDAINQADWAAQGATIALAVNDGFDSTFLTVESTGSHLRAQFVLDYQVSVDNPTHQQEFSFTIKLWAQRVSNGADVYSDTLTVTEVWQPPTATGAKKFTRSMIAFEFPFEGLAGSIASPVAYELGFLIETDAVTSLTCRQYRYIRGSDERKSQ